MKIKTGIFLGMLIVSGASSADYTYDNSDALREQGYQLQQQQYQRDLIMQQEQQNRLIQRQISDQQQEQWNQQNQRRSQYGAGIILGYPQ